MNAIFSKPLNKIRLNIRERQQESGKVKSVVFTFYINWVKEENVGDNAPRK